MNQKQQISPENILSVQNLSIGYYQRREQDTCLLTNVNLTIRRGEMICLLGPNGSGKSTLMRTIAGLHSPLAGSVLLQGISIRKQNLKEIARLLSLVLTEKLHVENLTVYHIVSLGRHPYTSWTGSLSESDNQKIKWALEQVGLLHYANKYINRLSDGEKQRVMIAKALAQDTPLILLDEPTAHLDLPNRVEIMRLLRKLAHETNKAILLSTHELDLALQAADVIWLISRQHPVKVGTPEDLVLTGSIEKVFHSKYFNFDRKTGNFTMNYQKRGKIQLIGNSLMAFWTQRALAREGYHVMYNKPQPCCVELNEKDMQWHIQQNGMRISCKSIEELLVNLRKVFCKPNH